MKQTTKKTLNYFLKCLILALLIFCVIGIIFNNQLIKAVIQKQKESEKQHAFDWYMKGYWQAEKDFKLRSIE